MIFQALGPMHTFWQSLPEVPAWEGHILLYTVVETPGMTEKVKIIQIFMRGRFMHMLNEDKVKSFLNTVWQTEWKYHFISPFASLLFFYRSSGKEN